MAPSAVEASGAAVCGGHFAEERGAGGMQMRQTQGGEPRSPEETGGRALGRSDGCLPRGRKEGVGEELGADGPGLDAKVRAWGWRTMGPGAAYTHPPAATFRFLVPEFSPGSGCVLHCVSKTLNAQLCIEGRKCQGRTSLHIKSISAWKMDFVGFKA